MSTSDAAAAVDGLFAGVDVGAGRVDAALIRLSGGECHFESFFAGVAGVGGSAGSFGSPGSVGSFGEMAAWCGDVVRVAVDAPGGLSAGAHLGDLSVAPKFRSGRCSEIPWPAMPPVPWVTPLVDSSAPGWMRTGFEVWASLEPAGVEVVEAFPAAVFHRLNGGRWPPRKSTPAGVAARLSLLSQVVALPASCSGWTHDQIDAVACAVVAALGRPVPHACGRPDGSAMWTLIVCN